MDHGWSVQHARSSLTQVVSTCWWSAPNWPASRRFGMLECVNIENRRVLFTTGFTGEQRRENVNSAERSVGLHVFSRIFEHNEWISWKFNHAGACEREIGSDGEPGRKCLNVKSFSWFIQTFAREKWSTRAALVSLMIRPERLRA